MGENISLIIIMLVVLGVSSFWILRKEKEKVYLLSNQVFPELNLHIFNRKIQNKTRKLEVKIVANKLINIQQINIELINKQREIFQIEFPLNYLKVVFPVKLLAGESCQFTAFIEVVKQTFIDSENKPKTFRVAVESVEKKKFKSHELIFTKKWDLVRFENDFN